MPNYGLEMRDVFGVTSYTMDEVDPLVLVDRQLTKAPNHNWSSVEVINGVSHAIPFSQAVVNAPENTYTTNRLVSPISNGLPNTYTLYQPYFTVNTNRPPVQMAINLFAPLSQIETTFEDKHNSYNYTFSGYNDSNRLVLSPAIQTMQILNVTQLSKEDIVGHIAMNEEYFATKYWEVEQASSSPSGSVLFISVNLNNTFHPSEYSVAGDSNSYNYATGVVYVNMPQFMITMKRYSGPGKVNLGQREYFLRTFVYQGLRYSSGKCEYVLGISLYTNTGNYKDKLEHPNEDPFEYWVVDTKSYYNQEIA